MHAIISGCGFYLPAKTLSNIELATFVDTDDNWIFTRTGIRSRRLVADDEKSSDMATKAIERALDSARLDISALDGVIMATTTPDDLCPATATKVQANLGMKRGFAFDIQVVCSGFVYALSIARSMISSGSATRIAVVGADTMSRLVDWNDRSTCVLFGDGAGAVIVEGVDKGSALLKERKNEGNREYREGEFPVSIEVLDTILTSDGTSYDILRTNAAGKIVMNGKEVFKQAVDNMAGLAEALILRNGLQVADVSWLLPHQANVRIVQAVADRIGLERSKAISVIEECANTSAASIPIALGMWQQRLKTGDKIIMAAAGAGMAFGAALLECV